MPDEVGLLGLGFIAERKRAQARLELVRVHGDCEHWLTHIRQAMQIRRRQALEVFEQLRLHSRSTKLLCIRSPNRDVIEEKQP